MELLTKQSKGDNSLMHAYEANKVIEAVNDLIKKAKKIGDAHTFIVEENGALYFYEIPAKLLGPVPPP